MKELRLIIPGKPKGQEHLEALRDVVMFLTDIINGTSEYERVTRETASDLLYSFPITLAQLEAAAEAAKQEAQK